MHLRGTTPVQADPKVRPFPFPFLICFRGLCGACGILIGIFDIIMFVLLRGQT